MEYFELRDLPVDVPKRGDKDRSPKKNNKLRQCNIELWDSQIKELRNLRPNMGWHIRRAIEVYLEYFEELEEDKWRFDNKRRTTMKLSRISRPRS